uniref:Uncharacterized protein n=1 Tax=Panagrolaimus sp. JU765 TaxID=591449 RepID=A0AC34PUU0_9BILA
MSIKSSLTNFWNRTKRRFRRNERSADRSANRAARNMKKAAKNTGEAIEDFVESGVKATKNLAHDKKKQKRLAENSNNKY